MVALGYAESLRRDAVRHLWMHNRDWVQMAEEGEPMIAVRGEGVRIEDSEGNSWIDVNGGYNSVNVGYGRTEIADAAHEQMARLPYFPNGTTTEPTAALAQKLAEITPGTLSRSFPVSGGSEANETALKIARAYHKRRGDSGRYKVISRIGSYHGTTAGVLWLGGAPQSQRADFEPSYPGMVYAPAPLPYRSPIEGETASECAVRCAEAVERLIVAEGPETVAAVIGEPVSVPLGAVVPADEYWPMLRDICDRYGVLLIADEVINGFGRTGRMFAVEHWDVVPDIMTVAKGIVSSYLPMAAAIAMKKSPARSRAKTTICATSSPPAAIPSRRRRPCGTLKSSKASASSRTRRNPALISRSACGTWRATIRPSATSAESGCWSPSIWSASAKARRRSSRKTASPSASTRVSANTASSCGRRVRSSTWARRFA